MRVPWWAWAALAGGFAVAVVLLVAVGQLDAAAATDPDIEAPLEVGRGPES